VPQLVPLSLNRGIPIVFPIGRYPQGNCLERDMLAKERALNGTRLRKRTGFEWVTLIKERILNETCL